MLLADIFGDLLGNVCLMFIVVVWAISWTISKLFQNEAVQDAARITFWSWFFSDDD